MLPQAPPPTHRAVMIRKIAPGDRDAVAAVFREHDRTDLPRRIGVTRRTLLTFHDLYIHLVEGDASFEKALYAAGDDPGFRDINARLATLLVPYDRDRPAMRQAQAEEFYHWSDDRPQATYRLLLEIRVDEARSAEFEWTWRRMAAVAARDPGYITQSLSRDLTDPGTYHLISDWTDEDAHERFLASPGHRALAAALRDLDAKVRATRTRISAHRPGPAEDHRTAGASQTGQEER
ncbi:TcmI family type II polyketide cyclase [Actinomadura mexicana]|uniref:Quinol monooxygenase YgiN n=1 Tax=Actinomadura mexicana TaxID=134959 RepID=A0A239BW23_9ACTN|nr:TcmI family type II polyketide cyclase [Actinomadura mexicana]SNS12116.1 Quinol monooxygenase YgiN [Actinomadura mexicana]